MDVLFCVWASDRIGRPRQSDSHIYIQLPVCTGVLIKFSIDRFSQQFTTLLKVLFPVRSIVVVHNVQGILYHVVV